MVIRMQLWLLHCVLLIGSVLMGCFALVLLGMRAQEVVVAGEVCPG